MTELHQLCRRLLEEGTVQVVIGYGQGAGDGPAWPVFITRAEDAGQLVWNDRCEANLVKYLLRPEVRALGKPAVVVKGCDQKALVVLEKESQIAWDDIVVIGVACQGVGRPTEAKCRACEVHVPPVADYSLSPAVAESPRPDPLPKEERYAELEEFLRKPPAERWAYWVEEFSRCVKCYACRQACPLCYCRQCIVDKNRPVVLDTSATLKGNFAWHITRAFHLAARCTGCDQCTRTCPAGINLRLLNLSLAKTVEEQFGYRPGADPDAEPVLGSYSQQDHEDFIR